MEFYKKRINKILNNLVAGIGIFFIALIVAIGFVTPTITNAAGPDYTEDDIRNNNIYFVSALTDIKSAKGMYRKKLKSYDENNNEYSFYTYQYDYNTDTDMIYYGEDENVVTNSSSGNASLSISPTAGQYDTMTTFTKYSDKQKILGNSEYSLTNGFIPYGVTHFDNLQGAKEPIFKEHFNDGDFVLLNNYDTHQTITNGNFSVENFYLSLGSPYIDENTTTPIFGLKVSGKLYSDNKTYDLVVNATQGTELLDANGDGTGKNTSYWNQYFDLKNIQASRTNDASSETYNIENPQGKYEFTFRFHKDVDMKDPEIAFQYTFYLLDSANYDQYPTLKNTQLNTTSSSLTNGETLEYFHNFTTDTPYIEYNPRRYNVSYTRANNKSIGNVSQTITSSITESTWTDADSNVYPLDIITYYNGKKVQKKVFVLTHYNDTQTIVEHMFVSMTNPDSETQKIIPTLYEDPNGTSSFLGYLDSGKLDFEYKTTTTLTEDKDTNTFVVTTYKTTSYEDRKFIANASEIDNGNYSKVDTTTYVRTGDPGTDITIAMNGSSVKFNKYKTTEGLVTEGLVSEFIDSDTHQIKNDVALFIHPDDLSITEPDPDNTLEELFNKGYSKYTLTKDANGDHYTLTIEFKASDNNGGNAIIQSIKQPISFASNIIKQKTYSVTNKAHSSITIEYQINEFTDANTNKTERYLSHFELSTKNHIKVDKFSNFNQSTLNDILKFSESDNQKLDLDYTYNLELTDLGIYNISYAYVCQTPSSDNTHASKFFINTKNKKDATDDTTNKKDATDDTTNNYSESTNFTAPKNYSAKKASTSYVQTQSLSASKPLFVAVSNKVSASNNVTLLDKTFTFNEDSNTLNNNISFNTEYTDSNTTFAIGLPNDYRSTYYTHSVDNNEHIITAYIQIGTYTTKQDAQDITYTMDSDYSYRTLTPGTTDSIIFAKTTNSITTFNFELYANVSEDQQYKDKFASIASIIKALSVPSIQVFDTITEECNQGQEKFHLFGSIAYFNRNNDFTDSGYSKLEQEDSRLGINYVSDVTNQLGLTPYVEGTISDTTTKILNKLYPSSGSEYSLLDINSIIVTDRTPILWNNFSTLHYDNKISSSKVYRYTKYQVDDNGNIKLNEASKNVASFTKDMYCSFDGLYVVVIYYKYNNLPNGLDNLIYYQVYTFIIDNSSPAIKVEVEQVDEYGNTKTDNGNILYQDLGLNEYTNRDVRISWEIPTYFQNDVYIEINKTDFESSSTDFSFNAIYQQQKITTANDTSDYVNGISDMGIVKMNKGGKLVSYYYVKLEIEQDDSEYDLSGNYDVIVHYGSHGKSTFTEKFVIDTQPIEGMLIKPVVKNNNGYEVNLSMPNGYDEDAQIINFDFTFRHDSKASDADIFVYYDKIELTAYDKFNQIVNDTDGKFGITTKHAVDGDENNISVGTPYVYDYIHETNSSSVNVSSKNVITSNTSCIYLFRLEDEAGNTARFVVFYDKTPTQFFVTPDPDPETHIVNDTTKVVWGDYKAIKINNLDEDEKENLDKSLNEEKDKKIIVDEYSKKPKEFGAGENMSTLSTALNYMRNKDTSSTTGNHKFNSIQIKKIGEDYYILLPVTNVKIEDSELPNPTNITKYYRGENKEGNKVVVDPIQEYYFFPSNPLTDETPDNKDDKNYSITLPVYGKDGRIQKYSEGVNKGKIKTKEYTVDMTTEGATQITEIPNLVNETLARKIKVTYYLEGNTGSTKTIYGFIGQGTYTFTVADELVNKTSGLIWMNLDKTQTMAYALFDYSNKIDKAEELIGDVGSYSASKMFITSLNSDNNAIPKFNLSYKFYAYNASLYKDYSIVQGNDSIGYTTIGTETFITIKMEHKTTKEVETVKIQTSDIDKDGTPYNYPSHSYPYDLEGTVTDDVYKSGTQYQTKDTDHTRKFSLAINTITDTTAKKDVTEEGLYIFKREYTNTTQADIGTDSMIIYRVYYIDRSGIINIATSNSMASSIYNIGEQINFKLASNIDQPSDYTHTIQAKEINAKQKVVSGHNYSNANFAVSAPLFTSNKVQIQYNMTVDKYDFKNSTLNIFNSIKNQITSQLIGNTLSKDNASVINSFLDNRTFNFNYFEVYYKLDLTLSAGASTIVDESDDLFSDSGANAYLKGSAYSKDTNSNYTRSNSFSFYKGLQTNNYYYITMNDQAGYTKFNELGEIANNNYLANTLKIPFEIKHSAPEGEFYSKYYRDEHQYDENFDEGKQGLDSIPTYVDENNMEKYALLKYFEEKELEEISSTVLDVQEGSNGAYTILTSTNKETMIFIFAITNDPMKAQIDPRNIEIYKGNINPNNLIFDRNDGIFSTSINEKYRNRQESSFVSYVIDGVQYYGIIIFDNNLEDILDKDENGNISPKEEKYLTYRLIDPEDNPDKETYYIKLQYLGKTDENGNNSDYKGYNDSGVEVGYYTNTYEVTVDRIKPMYNLTKLMSLDKYVYNDQIQTTTSGNYEKVFDNYKKYYNFVEPEDISESETNPDRIADKDSDFTRSDIENYFFALDTRADSEFVFESVDTLDNNNSLYIRKVDKNNYLFSLTPDDYRAYYYNHSSYLSDHPQFAPYSATQITQTTINKTDFKIAENTYYKLNFDIDDSTTFGNGANKLSSNFLINKKILQPNNYYEIIEEDQAGNYRVYAVYIPEQETFDTIKYTYQKNKTSQPELVKLDKNNIHTESRGMELQFTQIDTKDIFLKAKINIVAKTRKENSNTDIIKINHDIEVIFDPINKKVIAINRTLDNEIMFEEEITSIDTQDNMTNTEDFVKVINNVLDQYYTNINNKEHAYYSEFGYNVYIDIINRIGINIPNNQNKFDFEIDYVVAGSTLSPKFTNKSGYFEMFLEGQKGSTYLTGISAYRFNNGWNIINSDNSSTPQIFSKTEAELKKPITYQFSKGIYKFVLTDNFNRSVEFFYEFGISSSQTGGTLNFNTPIVKHTDGYTYSSDAITYTYDSSVYNIYIWFDGILQNSQDPTILENFNGIVYNGGTINKEELNKKYGITIKTVDSITTVTLNGNGYSSLSKYHIKTILATTSSGYTWGAELEENNDYFVYDKQVAVYSGIQNPGIKNLSGNILNTEEQLNLTEDFKLVTLWPNNETNKLDFNSRIIVTRSYIENGRVIETEYVVTSGQLIDQPGDYKAYVKNDLGKTSGVIKFTRGEGEISMYAVYGVNKTNKVEKKLTASSLINVQDDKVVFSYFVTDNYFNYKYTKDGVTQDINKNSNFNAGMFQTADLTKFIPDSSKDNIDVRVNSNLSIAAVISSVSEYADSNGTYPCITYKIYAMTKSGQEYIYRYVKIIFLPDQDDNEFASVVLKNAGDSITNLAERSIITSTASSMVMTFDFNKSSAPEGENQLYVPAGDTLYLDRYYNGELAETITINMVSPVSPINLSIAKVGLHEFVLRDLAGRLHRFADGQTKIKIYLINEVMFTVNNESAINNRVFNGNLEFDIKFVLDGMQLYNESSVEVQITKNGETETLSDNSGKFSITSPGYYTIKLSAMTQLLDNISTQVSSVFNFVILDTEIATNSFSISKGTGFTIEKIIKTINNESMDITNDYVVPSDSNSLLLLNHKEHGNSKFDITLRQYNSATNEYSSFTFRVWINNDTPIIISSIPAGTKSKESIKINYNPGLIYTQIGKGYITINDEVVTTFDETSESFVNSYSLDEKGTYWVKIFTEDNVLVCSYKYTKSEPVNKITKFILIAIAILAVIVVILFFLLRRKGKYR